MKKIYSVAIFLIFSLFFNACTSNINNKEDDLLTSVNPSEVQKDISLTPDIPVVYGSFYSTLLSHSNELGYTIKGIDAVASDDERSDYYNFSINDTDNHRGSVSINYDQITDGDFSFYVSLPGDFNTKSLQDILAMAILTLGSDDLNESYNKARFILSELKLFSTPYVVGDYSLYVQHYNNPFNGLDLYRIYFVQTQNINVPIDNLENYSVRDYDDLKANAFSGQHILISGYSIDQQITDTDFNEIIQLHDSHKNEYHIKYDFKQFAKIFPKEDLYNFYCDFEEISDNGVPVLRLIYFEKSKK